MGADKTVKNNDNQMPSDLSSDSVVRSLLGGEGSYETKEENDQLPFIPNYLLHPPLVLDLSNEHTVVKAECTIRHENKDGATVNDYENGENFSHLNRTLQKFWSSRAISLSNSTLTTTRNKSITSPYPDSTR